MLETLEKNIRGSLSEDIEKYGADILCLQETKLYEGLDCNIGKNRLIAFESTSIHHGN